MSAALQSVEEIADPLVLAEREAAAVDRRLTERRQKLADIEAERARIAEAIRGTALEGDVSALGKLSSNAAALADAVGALTSIQIPALEAERANAYDRASAIREARRVTELRSHVEPARQALGKAREEIGLKLEALTAAIVEHAALVRGFGELRDALADAGSPEAPEPSGRETLAALGVGRGQPFRPGFARVEIDVPAVALV